MPNSSTAAGIPMPGSCPPKKNRRCDRSGRGRAHARQVVQAWPHARAEVVEQLQSPGLNARYYGKCDPAPGKGGTTARQARVEALAAAMDNWQCGFPLFDQFDRFTTGFLEKATRKNQTTPDHSFFALCSQALDTHDAMVSQLSAYRQYLEVKLLKRIWGQLGDKKARRNILFFDDLLLAVHRAMTHEKASRTINTLQRQYRAALVDEFQDTDPLQYDIFHKLFSGGRAALFMIGDPKQAIYSFRGADVFSYLQAARKRLFTLYPDQKLAFPVAAGAGRQCCVRSSFTSFRPEKDRVSRCRRGAPARRRCHTAVGSVAFAQIRQGYRLPALQSAGSRAAIASATAGEIVRLLADTGRKVAAEQIAVLTRSHHQARIVKTGFGGRRGAGCAAQRRIGV